MADRLAALGWHPARGWQPRPMGPSARLKKAGYQPARRLADASPKVLSSVQGHVPMDFARATQHQRRRVWNANSAMAF
jgi:hypothetical protein